MNPRLPLVSALVLAVVTLAGCGSKSTTAPAGGGGTGGPASGPSLSLSFPARGVSQSATVADTGSWVYYCATHGAPTAGMRGTIVVTATATADSDTVAVGVNSTGTEALSFTPATVTIKPGGHVRWINRSAMTDHSVTRP